MKILIVTQKVDRTDPILGFFHRWLIEFAKRCDHVIVIGQLVGDYNLPENVLVDSMGKEDGYSKLHQILKFWKLQWSLGKEYDVVLVHMTPVWVVLGWFNWFILRKRVFLWYEARGGGWALPLSLRLVRKVFSATEYGLPTKSRRSVVTGHGIDTEFFAPTQEREKGLVVTIGRITERKHFDVILRAFSQLPDTYRLFLAGRTIRKDDEEELGRINKLIDELGITGRVTIQSMIHEEVRSLLQKAELMLHACRGGLDKVVLEAMASGCPVVSSSKAAEYVLPEECLCTDEMMEERAKAVLNMSSEERLRLSGELRRRVREKHSLGRFVERLVEEMN